VTTTTGAGGAYTFTSITLDTYTVTSTDPITGGTVSQTTTLTQDTTNTVNLTYIGHGSVTATVRYFNGNIASGAQLTISTSTNSNFIYAQATTDLNGQYTFTNVPTGPYTIRAYYPGQYFYSTTTGNFAGNGSTQQIAISLTPVGTISGTVTNANGTPASGVYVQIADTLSIYNAYALTDSAGNYGLFPVPADRVVNLFAYNQNNYGTAYEAKANNQQVPGDGQTLTVNLRYPGTANVQVTVLQSNGTPFSNTQGTVYLHSKDGLQSYTMGMSATGTATFNNVVEAAFVAFATINYGAFSNGSTTFTVTPAEDGTTVPVTINTSPTGTVQGTVYASDGITPILNGYYIEITDIDTGVNNYSNTNGAAYTFTNVQVGASGFTLTPYFNNIAYTAQAATGNITPQNLVVTQNFTLPVSSVSGTVYLNDGVTPVPYANVSGIMTINGNNRYFGANADMNGNYQFVAIPTGVLNETAYDSNNVVGTASVTLTSPTQIINNANINLGPTGMVMGTVYDENSQVVPNQEVDITSSGNNGGFSTAAYTDVNGNYTAADIPVGNITAVTTLPDNTTESNTGVLVNNGDTITINIGTPPAPPPPTTGSVFGTVYDSNQNPNPGATVTVTCSDPAMTVLTATTDQNGMFTATGVPFGMVTVTALLNDGVTTVGPVTGNVPDGITPVEIDLGLQNPGDVSGIVYDMNQNPIPGVNVTLSNTGDPNNTYSEGTAGDGSFDFGSMLPGVITITVTDSNNNIIGTATGTLPYGGDVVINVTTNTAGAMLIRPKLGRTKPGPTMASAPASTAPTRPPAGSSTATNAPTQMVGSWRTTQSALLSSQGGLQ
jgi:hypothetical protein